MSTHLQQREQQDPLPFDPASSTFPSLRDLPRVAGQPEGAAWVWGQNDEVVIPASIPRSG
jgi:hypothetical protein